MLMDTVQRQFGSANGTDSINCYILETNNLVPVLKCSTPILHMTA